jgi:hypothetical protein
VADGDTQLETTAWGRLVGILLIVVIDFCLLGSMIEFVAGLEFEERPWVNVLLRILIPLAVVGVDLLLMDLRRLAAGSILGTSARRWSLNFICFFWALAMPMGAVALFWVSRGGLPKLASYGVLYVLFALSAIGHFYILSSRYEIIDSAKYSRLWGRRAVQRFWLWRAERLEKREQGRVRQNFDAFASDSETYRTAYPMSRPPAGGFDNVTLEVLRKIFPELRGVPANGNGASGSGPSATATDPYTPDAAPAPSAGPSAGDDAATAENEYLRTILTQRRREDDSEVRP